MSSYKEQVGEWIKVRRDELRIPGTRLAELAGVSYKTITSAEAGRSEIKHRRAEVEDALRWERGSLTRAYRHGEQPTPAQVEEPTREPTVTEILVNATHQEQRFLVEVLSSLRDMYGQTGIPNRAAV